MDLDGLYSQNLDLETYDDLSISFNEAGAMNTPSGNNGKTLNWKMPPLVKKDTRERVERVAQLWLVLICIALVVSLVLAAFQGSLV